MNAIQSINAPAFTSRKYEQKRDYSGVLVGGTLTGLATANAVGSNLLAKKFFHSAMNNFKLQNGQSVSKFNVFKQFPKSASMYKHLGIMAALNLGAGVIVDLCNNYQRTNKKPNAINKNGNEYTRVNAGKIVGAGLGATITSGYAVALLAKNGLFKAMPSTLKIAAIASNMIYGAVGGLILGAVTDAISNHKAAKQADKV